jgi:hypothetical protein
MTKLAGLSILNVMPEKAGIQLIEKRQLNKSPSGLCPLRRNDEPNGKSTLKS